MSQVSPQITQVWRTELGIQPLQPQNITSTTTTTAHTTTSDQDSIDGNNKDWSKDRKQCSKDDKGSILLGAILKHASCNKPDFHSLIHSAKDTITSKFQQPLQQQAGTATTTSNSTTQQQSVSLSADEDNTIGNSDDYSDHYDGHLTPTDPAEYRKTELDYYVTARDNADNTYTEDYFDCYDDYYTGVQHSDNYYR